MSDKNLTEKLSSLENKLSKEKQSLSRGLTISTIIYLILVVFVLVYTTILSKEIIEASHPDRLADSAIGEAKDQIIQLNDQLLASGEKQVPKVAEKIVLKVMDLIPQAEEMAKNVIDSTADSMISSLKEEYLKDIHNYLSTTIDKVLNSGEAINDEAKAKELATVLAMKTSEELDKIMNQRFYSELDKLIEELDKTLDKPKSEMTKYNLAERNLLTYGTFLMKNPSEEEFGFIHGSFKASSTILEMINLERKTQENIEVHQEVEVMTE